MNDVNKICLDLYVDQANIGFDVNVNCVDYDVIVAIDDPSKSTNSKTLSINFHAEYINKVINNMGADNIKIVTIYTYLHRANVDMISYSAKRSGSMVQLTKQDDYYYGVEDVSGLDNAFYVDSTYIDNKQKFIEKCVKTEVRFFKHRDGSNWTVVCTQPIC